MIHWGEPGTATLLAAGYLGLLSLLWLALLAGLGHWARRWRLEQPQPESSNHSHVSGRDSSQGNRTARAPWGGIHAGKTPTAPGAASPGATPEKRLPATTVCVPARNEQGNIGSCVRSILQSEHDSLELIVVDDGSADATAREAREAAEGDPRFRLMQGKTPPAGWAGKPWALSQAAADASNDYLLFLDADVVLDPATIGTVLKHMIDNSLDMLSLFGSWRLETFWERAVIPVVGWLIRGSIDLDAVNDPARPAAFANGQFILVKRAMYEKLGGHGSVRQEVLEDVKLAQVFAHGAARTGLLHAAWAFRVRLYSSLGEIVRGYSKNLYEGLGRAPHVALGLVLFIIVGTLLPFIVLAFDGLAYLWGGWVLLEWPWLIWVGCLSALILLFRFRLERMEGRSGVHALTHPLGNIILMWIVLRSVFSLDVEWKGRWFHDGKAT